MPPKISIVTPSFNQAKYLGKTIESVLSQGYPNLEYLIMDGGSTDGSADIIKASESKLAYWQSKRDNGMYDAIQQGFEKTTGEIMAWINSDDVYFKDTFSIVAEIFSTFPEVEWVTGAYCNIDETGRLIRADRPLKWSKYHYRLLDTSLIQQEAVFWRRSLWEKAGGHLNTNLALAGDFELWLRFFNHTKLYSVNTPLGAFRFRLTDQKSYNQRKEYLAEVSEVLKNNPPTEQENQVLKKIHFYRRLLKMPFIEDNKHIKWRCEQLFDYPPYIKFNRHKMVFNFNNYL